MPKVVLFQPEIPPNTGNVARSCAATCTELHLIEPLGFRIDDRTLKRAGLDYWPWVQLECHSSWEDFLRVRSQRGGRLLALSRHASEPYHQIQYRKDDWLLFGRESSGLPQELLSQVDQRLLIPMPGSIDHGGGVRSLNLATAVGVVLFEAIRQLEHS
ncbi:MULTISPECIES: tRNA (cytidine(34)-2'-O)-methyltransferase [unclassified Synechococcus]|uniref:tRNA (cytidine(34)-2'-O)-methyltransferase n=1 Tax=unclassified Synechococcus TaxID=2626047 RepID=UPI0020012BE4|nr:tRNA (cytidine(34)-2'-O)-methyltransferase [Synechococcus sp. A10-1-5-1]UPM50502.1 tRNA (cytidine(34)-2'-O)-methyltransferase [Synechococcus sp. A10-1-5-1]